MSSNQLNQKIDAQISPNDFEMNGKRVLDNRKFNFSRKDNSTELEQSYLTNFTEEPNSRELFRNVNSGGSTKNLQYNVINNQIDNTLLPNRSASDKTTKAIDEQNDENENTYQVILNIAQKLAAGGDYIKAASFYEKLLKMDQGNGYLWIALGHCTLMLDNIEKSFNCYMNSIGISQQYAKDPQLLYGIGLIYDKLEAYENAELAFRTVIKLDSDFPQKGDVLFKLGLIFSFKTQYDQAILHFREAILQSTFSQSQIIETLCRIGMCFEIKDNFQEALQSYKYALSLDEQNPKVLQFIGWLLFQYEKYDEALDYLARANQNKEDDPDIWYMIGRCYLVTKNYKNAYNSFQHALNILPVHSNYWCSLGILLQELKLYREAFEAFSTSLKINPNFQEALLNIGGLYELTKQNKDAVIVYMKLLQINSKHIMALTRISQLQKPDSEINNEQELQFYHPQVKVTHISVNWKVIQHCFATANTEQKRIAQEELYKYQRYLAQSNTSPNNQLSIQQQQLKAQDAFELLNNMRFQVAFQNYKTSLNQQANLVQIQLSPEETNSKPDKPQEVNSHHKIKPQLEKISKQERQNDAQKQLLQQKNSEKQEEINFLQQIINNQQRELNTQNFQKSRAKKSQDSSSNEQMNAPNTDDISQAQLLHKQQIQMLTQSDSKIRQPEKQFNQNKVGFQNILSKKTTQGISSFSPALPIPTFQQSKSQVEMDIEQPAPKPLFKQSSGFQPVKNISPIQIITPKYTESEMQIEHKLEK